MEYYRGTTEYNGDGIELCADLRRANFRRSEIILRGNVPTLVAESLDMRYRIGIQREDGRYVIVSVDDSVEVFTSSVARVREIEESHPFESHLTRPITKKDLEELAKTPFGVNKRKI